MLYLFVIIFGTLVVGVIDGLLFASNLFDGIVCATLTTASIFAIDGILAFLIRRLPERWFSYGKRIFAVTKKERKIYRALKINAWKDYIPELGGFTSFHKNELKSVSDEKYLKRFILESNYGVVIHLANAILGIVVLLLPYAHRISIWLPIFTVNFVLSILPFMILRYHLPVLERLCQRASQTRDV